nr:hypothetical protein [Mycoplasmopsis bovis]
MLIVEINGVNLWILIKKLLHSMQAIALDSINNAGGGHIGSAIDICPIMYAVVAKHMKISADHPKWISRDRLILSAGQCINVIL